MPTTADFTPNAHKTDDSTDEAFRVFTPMFKDVPEVAPATATPAPTVEDDLDAMWDNVPI